MSEFNQYALYSMNTQNANSMSDIVERIHHNLEDLSEYAEAKNYLNKYFKNLNKPGDKDGFNFSKLNKSILCKMDEASTIMVLCKRNDCEDIDWIKVFVPEKNS